MGLESFYLGAKYAVAFENDGRNQLSNIQSNPYKMFAANFQPS